MRRKPKAREDNGFAEWGGYMAAKEAKLAQQFDKDTSKQIEKRSDIFKTVTILVNGYTKPGADELKLLMSMHGGGYHLYQNQAGRPTTHIIATNLPNVKINQQGNIPVVSPEWITDSIEVNKLLDHKKYLLYTNHSRTQPKLNFASISKEERKIPSGNETFAEPQQKYTKTAADPQFLSEFYNNSRLHLISTLGAEFKQLVNTLREKSTGNFIGLQKLLSIKKDVLNNEKCDNVVMHIDMDCFFVSVGLRNRPELQGKPVAVTHSKGGRSNANGVDRQAEIDLYVKRLPETAVPRLNLIDNNSSMAEIASCSYEARKCGVHNGMFVGAALKLCPDLVTIPYDFQDYRDVSSILYRTIAEYTVDIEAVSCDEMYVDITKILEKTGLSINEWAMHIRNTIIERTGCPCSTGFGANRLQARIATKKAKPNGQFYLEPDDVENYMFHLPLDELPGVGYATLNKLNNLGLKTCGDLLDVPLTTLKNELGQKNSETIYHQARGIDRRPLNYDHQRKSVSADINYGIRFKNNDEALVFLDSLSKEVHNRLSDIKMKAKSLTLKLLIRAEGAPKETAKYLGCGICDSVNRSISTNYYLDNPQAIFKEAKILYNKLNIVPEDLRGVGIQLSKLEKILVTNKNLTKFLNQSTITKPVQNNLVVQNTIPNIEIKENDVSNKNSTKNNSKSKTKLVNTSKMGRSRKILSSTNTNLTNYFKNSKIETNIKGDKIKNNAIDLNILKELPKNLQEEIMKEYNLPKVVSPDPQPPNESIQRNTIEKQEFKEKKGFSCLSKDELKMLLKSWIQNEETPKDHDIKMLGDFLKGLVEERRIEYLSSIVNLLHRHLSKKSCKWHMGYFKLLNQFQETMLLIYGNTLLAPTEFSCDNQH